MAKYDPTPYLSQFPPGINPQHFASWLSGFADGEASFTLTFSNRKRGGFGCAAAFAIGLRADDLAILQVIQSYWGCGLIYYCKKNILPSATPGTCPGYAFRIFRTKELTRIVIPHFERFPLLAKKHRDFSIWKEGVNLLTEVRSRKRTANPPPLGGGHRRWTDEELRSFQSLCRQLKAQRKYNATDLPAIVEREKSRERTLFDDLA